jgi:hypothetical protein
MCVVIKPELLHNFGFNIRTLKHPEISIFSIKMHSNCTRMQPDPTQPTPNNT